MPAPRRPRRAPALVALVGLVAILAAACSSSGSGSSAASGASSRVSSGSAASPGGGPRQVYLSVGDSYAAGYQPSGPKVGSTTTNGFAYQVVDGAKAKGYDLELVNVGCDGATTTSILQSKGCTSLGPGAAPYPDETQAEAAERVLKDDAGNVALVTVSIGGNDVTRCAMDANPISCVTAAVTSIKNNLATLLGRLRAAAGPGVPIVGITYPDVILGLYTSGKPADQQLAQLSVTAFQTLINPTLQQTYEAAGATFLDVTAATGAYGPLSDTTDLAPYGTIPVPVAKVCELTYFCELRDIHPRTEGYAVIASLVVGALPAR